MLPAVQSIGLQDLNCVLDEEWAEPPPSEFGLATSDRMASAALTSRESSGSSGGTGSPNQPMSSFLHPPSELGRSSGVTGMVRVWSRH
jgi:hypothetical protein